MLYPGYRCYLEPGHRFRSARRTKDFNGKIEKRLPPERPTVEFWPERWKDVERKIIQLEDFGMRHLSIFHRLLYFKVRMVNSSTFTCSGSIMEVLKNLWINALGY